MKENLMEYTLLFSHPKCSEEFNLIIKKNLFWVIIKRVLCQGLDILDTNIIYLKIQLKVNNSFFNNFLTYNEGLYLPK